MMEGRTFGDTPKDTFEISFMEITLPSFVFYGFLYCLIAFSIL